MLVYILLISFLLSSLPCHAVDMSDMEPLVDQNPFDTNGIAHDPVVFHDASLEYPYHMIVSHVPDTYAGVPVYDDSPAVHRLYRTKNFTWDSTDGNWELVTDTYQIQDACQEYPDCFEYDDGVKVDGKYYIYENGVVYTFTGALENSSGNWVAEGSWPHALDSEGVPVTPGLYPRPDGASGNCDDAGIYYEDGVFHLFGEYGDYVDPKDGVSLSHYTSTTGLGDWTLISTTSVDPDPINGDYGVGDPSIIKIHGRYYIYCDRESQVHSEFYRVVLWESDDIYKDFTDAGTAVMARRETTEYWDSRWVQDIDMVYLPDKKRFAGVLNMDDIDGIPDKDESADWGPITQEPTQNLSRIIGTYFSTQRYKTTKGASFR